MENKFNRGLNSDRAKDSTDIHYKMSDNMKIDSGKYYTPTIEEFHVGFEFEELLSTWNKRVVQVNMIVGEYPELKWLSERLRVDSIRVKYLDHEDIVAEGWEKEKEVFGTDIILYRNQEALNKLPINRVKKFYLLDYSPSSRLLRISRNIIDKIERSERVFQGFVRNRSELKTIMRMVGLGN